MAVVTICSDFGAPKNEVWHCPLFLGISKINNCDAIREDLEVLWYDIVRYIYYRRGQCNSNVIDSGYNLVKMYIQNSKARFKTFKKKYN